MKENNSSAKRCVRNDIVLILCVLAVATLGLIYLFVFRDAGNTVTVKIDGKVYKTYSLNENITEDIHTGKDGEHNNRLVIKDGKAYIETATCPDGICVAHSPIFRDGESIVCLPNGVVITVVTEADGPDIIV